MHASKRLWTTIHGDDYVTGGPQASLAWLETELLKTYDIKTQKVVPNGSGVAEGKVLNRILRWKE